MTFKKFLFIQAKNNLQILTYFIDGKQVTKEKYNKEFNHCMRYNRRYATDCKLNKSNNTYIHKTHFEIWH